MLRKTEFMARTIKEPKSLIHHNLSIKDFFQKRNRILIVRDTGGLGDILMCRMLFEDVKALIPDSYLVFACPTLYHPAVDDHPFVDEITDSRRIDENDYILSYNITAACGKYENKVAPLSDKNRSDIWAAHCGFELTKHNMHLNVNSDTTQRCRELIEQYRKDEKGPVVLLSPISAIMSKNLDAAQMNLTAKALKDRGYLVLGLHRVPIHELEVPTLTPEGIKQYFAFVNASDYIITVDTSTFHVAGGLNKPSVAVFSWADGVQYGKWYEKFILVQRHRNHTPGWSCGPCYRWGLCPKVPHNVVRKPCITEITAEEIVGAFDQMIEKWPVEQ